MCVCVCVSIYLSIYLWIHLCIYWNLVVGEGCEGLEFRDQGLGLEVEG